MLVRILRKDSPGDILVGCNGCGPVEKRMTIPQKAKIELPYHPVMPFLSANDSSVMMFSLSVLIL